MKSRVSELSSSLNRPIYYSTALPRLPPWHLAHEYVFICPVFFPRSMNTLKTLITSPSTTSLLRNTIASSSGAAEWKRAKVSLVCMPHQPHHQSPWCHVMHTHTHTHCLLVEKNSHLQPEGIEICPEELDLWMASN